MDYEANATLLVRLKVTDEHNATLERRFVINLLNDPADDPVVPDETYMQVRKVTTPHRKMTTIVRMETMYLRLITIIRLTETIRVAMIITRHRAMHTTLRMETSLLQVMGMKLLIPISLRQQILSKRPNSSIPARKEITLHRMPGICHLRKLTILLKAELRNSSDKHVIGDQFTTPDAGYVSPGRKLYDSREWI